MIVKNGRNSLLDKAGQGAPQWVKEGESWHKEKKRAKQKKAKIIQKDAHVHLDLTGVNV